MEADPALRADARWQLIERITASPPFQKSARLRDLLRFMSRLQCPHSARIATGGDRGCRTVPGRCQRPAKAPGSARLFWLPDPARLFRGSDPNSGCRRRSKCNFYRCQVRDSPLNNSSSPRIVDTGFGESVYLRISMTFASNGRNVNSAAPAWVCSDLLSIRSYNRFSLFAITTVTRFSSGHGL
jgi:hypothetical protein